MRSAVGHWARRGFLAAALTLSAFAAEVQADVAVAIDAGTGHLMLDGLSSAERDRLMSDTSRVTLQVAGLGASQGMPLKISETADGLQVKPRFALRAGATYHLQLDLGSGEQAFEIALPAAEATTPRLAAFAPSQAVLPANTLRLYLTFSEPMALGALRDAVTLMRSDGTEVDSPFLTLGPELWDKGQTRVTLLFDPGRIKQGVGPNLSHGAPLVAGESYHLVIGKGLRSTKGVPLAQDITVAFRVGPAEARAIVTEDWDITPPKAASQTPLSVAFDRIMDEGPVRRMITLQDANGKAVQGHVHTDGGGWSFVPDHPWTAGEYALRIDPALEDIAGNAVHQAFDAPEGTIGTVQRVVTLPVSIGG